MPLHACPKPWVTGPLDEHPRTRLLPGCGAFRALLRRAGRGRPAARRRDAPARLAGRPAARLGHRGGGPGRARRGRRRQDGGLRPKPAGRPRSRSPRAGRRCCWPRRPPPGWWWAPRFVGAGIGLFWVSSQTLLGRSSGGDGSERAFAHHYAAYTLGVAGGSAIVGSAAAVAAPRGHRRGRCHPAQLRAGPGGDARRRWRCGAHAASATPSRADAPAHLARRPWRCSYPTCCWSRRWR